MLDLQRGFGNQHVQQLLRRSRARAVAPSRSPVRVSTATAGVTLQRAGGGVRGWLRGAKSKLADWAGAAKGKAKQALEDAGSWVAEQRGNFTSGAETVRDAGRRKLSAAAEQVSEWAKSGGRKAKAAWRWLKGGASKLWSEAKVAATDAGKKVYTGEFTDLDATQYLVTGEGAARMIEAIQRRVENGKVRYYTTGLVTKVVGSERPQINSYGTPRAMPEDWYPRVAHVNGMMVKPKGGLSSAEELLSQLQDQGDVLLGTDVPEVLFTYSAHRGFVTDLVECLKGKLYINDDVTAAQTQIMLDAVHGKQRVSISAHSRGTIKTDNAVLNAHAQLTGEYQAQANATVEAMAVKLYASLDNPGALTADITKSVYARFLSRDMAKKRASQEMDKYIQLIYAGNAVQFPSSKTKLQLVVASADPVTIAVGKYFKWAKLRGNKGRETTKISGGHGFDKNYAAKVAELIVKDIDLRRSQPAPTN